MPHLCIACSLDPWQGGVSRSGGALAGAPFIPILPNSTGTSTYRLPPTQSAICVFTKYLFQALCSFKISVLASPSSWCSLQEILNSPFSYFIQAGIQISSLQRGPPWPPYLMTGPHTIQSPHRDFFFFRARNIWHHVYVPFFSGSHHWNIRSWMCSALFTAVFLPRNPVSGTELPFSTEKLNEWEIFLRTSSA